MYSYEQAFQASLEYFNGDDLATSVFVDKYALRDNEDNLLEKTPEDMHWRIAKEFARIEKKKFKQPLTSKQIFDYLDRYRYIVPQGSPLYGIGNKNKFVSLSNCYVIDCEDSYGGICKADEELVQIAKRRGGIGLDLSKLRPKGTPTKNASRTSTGVLSWMKRFSNSIREVGMHGRRGALMETLDIRHPEILTFVQAKSDLKEVTGANVSVKVNSQFLHAVKNNQDFELKWPIDSNIPKISKRIKARELWGEIVKQAKDSAEPGILLWDNITNESPADCYYEFNFNTQSVNPCAELPLCCYDSCRLTCINLLSYIDKPFTSKSRFNYKKLFEHAKIAQRLMDNLVDLELECIKRIQNKVEKDPEDEMTKIREKELWHRIWQKCSQGRRTGLGITALGDTIAALNLKYGSHRSIEIAEKIFQTIKFGAYQSSIEMAKELEPFSIWDHEKEKKNSFLQRFKEEELDLENGEIVQGKDIWNNMKKYGRRNIALLTIAPTGSVSTQTQTTSGVEPVYMLSYKRRKKINPNDKNTKVDYIDNVGDSWTEFEIVHHGIQKWKKITEKDKLEESPYWGATAEEINWKNRVKLQGAIQRHNDHGISSTINLPENISVDEVKKIYELAHEYGLKGVTIYRQGSRSGVLVKDEGVPKYNAPRRPKELKCDIHHVSVKGKKYFVLVGLLKDDPYEVFAGRSKYIDDKLRHGKIIKKLRPKCYKAEFEDGSEISPITIAMSDEEEALTRTVSLALRHGADIKHVSTQLDKTEGEMTSFAKSIARALRKYSNNKSEEKCPNCGNNLVMKEGCLSCSCGWSKCL